jgi:hypothetical protein
MATRRRLAALVGAAALTVGVASTAMAAAPSFGVDLTISALPTSVPSGGGDVDFTVTVQNTGSGGGGSADLQQVNVATDNGGCTLSAPSGTGAPDTLAVGDTWTYTCTVTGVAPDTTVNAWVYACNSNGGPCNVDSHDATDTDGVTVTLGEEVPPPTPLPSQPNTAMAAASQDGGSINPAWMLAIVIGVLGASALILKPAPARRR